MISENRILERFLRYIAVDTRSCEDSKTCPSTPGQLVLAKMLRQELLKMGVKNARLTANGYLSASIPANTEKTVPAVGFLAHLDTAPRVEGACKKPVIERNYDGKDIILNSKKRAVLSRDIFPELGQYLGQTIIHTDGTTLLGADDKAGIAEIMTAVEYFLQHPEVEHGKICIAFTPDEEIGSGVDHFDIDDFGADYAYTVDGGEIGELEYENFNAAEANITIHGLDIHPGYAKNKMINSQLIALELEAMLPRTEKPEHTEGYEGFFLLNTIQGSIKETQMHYIIRDHCAVEFTRRKGVLEQVIETLIQKYNTVINCQIREQYLNMKEKIEPVKFIIDIARQAMIIAGVTPRVKPIRGGTDGAHLSWRGLPCPNIFTGGHNFHGIHEYVVLESMTKATETIINIVKLTRDN